MQVLSYLDVSSLETSAMDMVSPMEVKKMVTERRMVDHVIMMVNVSQDGTDSFVNAPSPTSLDQLVLEVTEQ